MSDDTLPFDLAGLDKLAETAVRVGLNLQPGQDLILSGSIEALPLVRRIARQAYAAGAGVVTTLFDDEEITLARYRHGTDHTWDAAPDWLFKGMADAFGDNTARMRIAGDNPMLLAGEDPANVGRVVKATSKAAKPAMERVTSFDTNWSIVAYPGRAWATLMFPDLDPDEAQKKLAEAIFAASRVDLADPIAAWAEHDASLQARRDWLNDQRFNAIHFRGHGTDLRVGLADAHLWAGGSGVSKKGVRCMPNIPTEEVFTTPHARKVEGVARATKPLAYQGSVIENIEVRFEAGKIVEAKADKGEAAFMNLLDTDEGARRIGEVALVPNASPISESGVLFYNTLFDENAACHIALGQCYTECLVDGSSLSPEEIAETGGNSSLTHVDWMIGGPETEIDGIGADGSVTPVFRNGNWAN